ncbi:hypothetical protein DFP72DRAFT_858478, partial [Ephemerocybe angulata]
MNGGVENLAVEKEETERRAELAVKWLLLIVRFVLLIVDNDDKPLLHIFSNNMQAVRQDVLPPSGIEFAASLRLIPTVTKELSPRLEFVSRVLCNLVVARSNLLRIFEVREEPSPIQSSVEEEREKRAHVRKGTEAVEGEVEMDTQGDGFISVSKTIQKTDVQQPTVTRIYFVREHKLHGIVTGIEGVKTISSLEDKLDRLLVSFKDAKIALLEWSDAVHDLVPVSIHTYERAPQLMSLTAPLFRSELRADPLSRCAALGLPNHSIAILPFYQSQAELDVMDQDSTTRDVPYSPSFILNLASQVDEAIHTVVDFSFLPGFNNPTLAVLYQTEQTWTGRLKEYKDTTKLIIFTLDISLQSYPIITSVEGLPYDALRAGVSRSPVNGWAARTTDLPMGPEPTVDLKLEGSRAIFVDDKTLFLILKDGNLYPVEIGAEGEDSDSSDAWCPPTGWRRRVPEEEEGEGTAVVDTKGQQDWDMDDDLYDDDDDLYGPSKPVESTTTETAVAPKKMRSVLHPFSERSSPRVWISPSPELVTATGSGIVGGFTLFQRDLPRPHQEEVARPGRKRGDFGACRSDRARRVPGGVSVERGVNPFNAGKEGDTCILSTDANPSPGLSRIATKSNSGKSDINFTTRVPGTMVGAAAFFQRTAILVVMTNAIKVLEPDGTERQTILDMDGKLPRPKIRACSISDPFVLIMREDDSLGLFI